HLEAGDEAHAPAVVRLRRAVADHEVGRERVEVEELAPRVEPRQAAAHLEVGKDPSPALEHPGRGEVCPLEAPLQLVLERRLHREGAEADAETEAPRTLDAEEAELPGDGIPQARAEIAPEAAPAQARVEAPARRAGGGRKRRGRGLGERVR